MMKPEMTSYVSRWPNRIAKLLALIVFPLIWVGGLVTTSDAGMAVPDWPNTYNYNMFAYPIRDWFLGPWDLFVEHGHRLLGSLSGIIAIALCVVTFLMDRRTSVRRWSILILALVIGQGILGGQRVVRESGAGVVTDASVRVFCRW
jgi:cytochrome c oxidase assembly protein subunit 15